MVGNTWYLSGMKRAIVLIALAAAPVFADDVHLRGGGQITGEGAREFRRSCPATESPIALDIGDLHSADEDALDAILELQAGGAELRGGYPYIALILDGRRRTT